MNLSLSIIVLNLVLCDESLKNKYIIKLKSDFQFYDEESHIKKVEDYINISNQKNNFLSEEEGESKIDHVFDQNVLEGYSGEFNDDVIEFIKNQPEVESYEQDEIFTIDNPIEYTNQTIEGDKLIQKNAPWGLARIFHQNKINDGTYEYSINAGEGVSVYVVDTGIEINHPDFEKRARWGVTIPKFEKDIDGNGHGTHCAGTIASKNYGVAKKANLIAVKVMKSNGRGLKSDIIKGLEWVSNDVKNNKITNAIVNLSLGGGKSGIIDNVVEVLYNQGIFLSVAAGNSNIDACKVSPASSPYSFTVGATDKDDKKAPFSNYGKCINIFAPGKDIKSTWIGLGNKIISGTSMAAPHVAGVAAYLISMLKAKNEEITSESISKILSDSSIKGLITKLDEQSPNRLLHL